MKRKTVSTGMLVLLLAAFTAAFAADVPEELDTGWKLSAEANLTQTQNAYSDNWSGSENGNVTWTFNLNSLAEKKFSESITSRSTLKLAFGQTQTQDRVEKYWSEPAKSTDLIDLESLLLYSFHGFADPYVGLRVLSQFYDSIGDTVEWLNPVTITESAGLAKTLLKNEKQEWITRLGFGVRQHIDRLAIVDDSTMERGTKTANDGGVELVSELTTPLAADRIKMTSKLTVFTAIYSSTASETDGTPAEGYWQVPDVNLETIFTASITKYIMVNLYTQLLYDKEVSLGGRFKETLSLGLTYTLF